jgi:membrane fusion protein (multidrug efflux system)
MTKRPLPWMSTGAFALLAMAACARDRRERAQAEPAPMPVTTARVSRAENGVQVSIPGTVAAQGRAVLAARVAAAVVELPLREGQPVAAGAIVVRLDDHALRSAMASAEAAAHAAEAEDTRTRALLDKGAATPREAEETAARAAAARALLEADRESLSYAVLRAPFAGTIAARRVHVGDVISPGAPLLEIEGDQGLEIRATLDARSALQVRVGQHVAAQVDGEVAALDAVIRSLSPAGDPATHRFEVRATLPETAGIRSGVFARLLVPAAGPETRLLVPEAAVFRRGGLAGVFVVEQGRARLRWVAVGDATAGLIEARAGLESGETVALDPAALADGVRVEEAAKAPEGAS